MTAIDTAGVLKRRFMSVGEEIRMGKVAALLGDPVEAIAKNYRLSLRDKEARIISVEVTG
jgi:Fe2+ transport system protein FeoA